jgi:hypothetical protein
VEFRNFGPIEGPYPQSNLPQVRWGYGPSSSIRLPASNKAQRLQLEAQTALGEQNLEIRMNGKVVHRHAFAALNAPEIINVGLPQTDGERIVEFSYSQSSGVQGNDPRNMAVLFRRIQIE